MYKYLSKITLLFLLSSIAILAQNTTGLKYIQNERYKDALVFFNSVIKSAKSTESSAEANFYIGQIYFIKESYDSAKTAYLNGIKVNPEYGLNYAGLVKINLIENDIKAVEKNTAEALDLTNEKDDQIYIVLSEGYVKVKDYKKALELGTIAKTISPNSVNPFLNYSKICLASMNGTEVLQNCEEALRIDGKVLDAYVLKAKVYMMIDNNVESLNLLYEALKYDSTYAPIYSQMAEAYSNLKDYSKASENYSKYILFSEKSFDKLKRYASILYLNKEYGKSIETLKDIIAVDSNSVSSIRITANSYLKLNDYQNGNYFFNKLFSLDSVDFIQSDYENYSNLLSELGEDEKAIFYMTKIIELDKSRKDIYGKLSVLYFKNKKWDNVISSLKNKGTLTAQEYFDLGKAYIFKGDNNITHTMNYLDSNLKLSVDQYNKLREVLLSYQSDLANAKGDNQMASAAVTKVENSVDSFIENRQKKEWNNIKTSWLDSLKTNIGIEYVNADSSLQLLVNKAPKLSIAYIWHARVKANFDPTSELGLAKPFYEKFIELAKNDFEKLKNELVEAYSYLGYYYYLQNNNQASLGNWQEVLKIDSENVQAKEAIKQLK